MGHLLLKGPAHQTWSARRETRFGGEQGGRSHGPSRRKSPLKTGAEIRLSQRHLSVAG